VQASNFEKDSCSCKSGGNFKPAQAPVGAGMPANTGGAGARHSVACFAGKPAPTGIASGLTGVCHKVCSAC